MRAAGGTFSFASVAVDRVARRRSGPSLVCDGGLGETEVCRWWQRKPAIRCENTRKLFGLEPARRSSKPACTASKRVTLTGMRKHVGVLEEAGLVITEKVGRVRNCRIGARRLDEVAAWIDTYHQVWEARFCELDKVVEELKWKEKLDGCKKEK